jgi:hypothetical protein
MAKRMRRATISTADAEEPKVAQIVPEPVKTEPEEKETVEIQEEETIKNVVEEKVEVSKVEVNPIYKWKKLGGGALRFPNRIIKPGQVFTARESEIPSAFMRSLQRMDVFVPDTTQPQKVEKQEVVPVNPTYFLKHRNGSWYDIVDRQGKRLNEKALQKDAAEALLEQLK